MSAEHETLRYYQNYDEDSRLTRHPIEFATTTYVLNQWIKPHSHILDVATGTGAYAFYMEKRGCTVVARDLVPEHIEQLEGKLKGLSLSITTEVGNANDLSAYDDGVFDAVLCMGPIYHILPDAIHTCILECLRVLKPGGVLVSAYINKYADYQQDTPQLQPFVFYSAEEIETLFAGIAVEKLQHCPVDREPFEAMQAIIEKHPGDLAIAHDWLTHHPQTFSRLEMDYNHGLYIARKPITQ